MQVDNIAKLIELYAMQNMNPYGSTSTDGSSFDTSQLFNVAFECALQKILNNNTDSMDALNADNTALSNVSNASNAQASGKIDDAIKSASQKYGVDSDLIKAVINQESSFNPNAVSSAGALGLMQLMPSTARSLGVENPFNVLENVNGGTQYLSNLLKTFSGNKELALSAYNGGISRMNSRNVTSTADISKMPSETVNYVQKVMDKYNSYKNTSAV